ncbi:MAG: hypothetical protein RL326_1446 [Pseudomonadota bacterium]
MLEQRRNHTDTVECRGFTLRSLRDGSQLVGLEIDVRHPKFADKIRTFELSEYLRQGLLTSPTTVAQIVSKDTLESTRLDALRDLTRHIATPELRREGVRCRDAATVVISKDVTQDTQPLRLEHTLGTSWSDVLQGRTRQSLSVFRNGKPLLEFSVAFDERGEVAVALINLVPLELRWPILTRDGAAVDRTTVWKSIDEYVTFLDATKHYPWPQALEHLGAMQDLRSGRGADHEEDTVSCVTQVALSVLDENRYATDPSFSLVSPSRAPFGLDGFARALPDERVLWSSGPDVAGGQQGFELSLGGFSTYGAPYKVTVTIPHGGAGELWDAVRQIRFSSSWSELELGLVLLAKTPGVRFSVSEVTDREAFPRRVNELLERLCQRGLEGVVEVGVGDTHLRGNIATNAWIVGGLIRGLAPIHAHVTGPSFSSTWRCQGFLDEELHGQLVFTNQLGGELIVTPHGLGGPWQKRLETIETLMVTMKERPMTFARDVLAFEGVDVRSENFPTRLGDCSHANLDRVALLWRRSFKDQHATESPFSAMSAYRATELRDGRWALARQGCVGGDMSYHTLVVGPHGVEVMYLSGGERGWLGQLQGTEVKPGGGRKVFKDGELQIVFPLLVPSGSSVEPKSIQRIITNSIGDVSIRGGVSMREFDPERNQKDIVFIASEWLWGLFQ